MGGFRFKQFEISQDRCAMKVGTDGVLLGAWASGGSRILDVGAGTGLISLMMAQRFPDAQVVGIDVDEEACLQAQENVGRSLFKERVHIVNSRLQDFVSDTSDFFPVDGPLEELGEGCFDAVVSNPPFFVGSLKNPDKKRAVARHSDSLPFRDLWQGVKRLLSADGMFSVILPAEVVEQFSSEGYVLGFYLVRRCAVKTVGRKPPKRYLLTFSKCHPSGVEDVVETMTDEGGNRSEWYAKLTDEFYL